MDEIKSVLVGTGFIGRQHLEAIRRIPGSRIVAVADKNEELARKTAADMDIPEYYTDYKEMLEKTDADVIHICTVNSLHYKICKAAIERGIHIYCEKPLTLRTDEAYELAEEVKAKGLAAAADFNYRNNVMVREMKDRIRSGKSGEILTVWSSYLQDWMMYDTDYDWRLEKEHGGQSRAVADIGSHCFDTLQFVCGRKIRAVYAKLLTVHEVRKKMEKTGGTFSGKIGSVLNEITVTSEDAAYILVSLEDGCMGIIHVSQVSAGKKNELVVHVDGSTEALEWNQERPDRLWIGHRDCGNEEMVADPKCLSKEAERYTRLPAGHAVGWSDAFYHGIRNYYEGIRNGTFKEEKQDYATFEEAAYIMKLVDACMESNQSDRWIEIR